jgi:hypothetical protein
LSTVLSLEDLFDIIEVVAIDAENRRRVEASIKKNAET